MFHTLGHGELSHRQGRGAWNAGGMPAELAASRMLPLQAGQPAASDPSVCHDFWPPWLRQRQRQSGGQADAQAPAAR